MNYYIKAVALLSRFCGIIAATMIALSVLVVCQMVIMRYVLETSSIWQTEFVTYLLISATFIGSPYVLLTRGHVNVDLLPLYLGHKGRMVLALVAAIISLAFCLVLSWTAYEFWHEAWTKNWLSDSMWAVRLWIPYASMPIGFIIMSAQYIADIISLIRGDEAPFGLPRASDA